MTSLLLHAASAALLLAAVSCHDNPPTAPSSGQTPPATYRLVWSDDFDRDGVPDATRWSYDVGGHGWGNNELQFYTAARRENARVEGGHLVIEARREPWEGLSYTSARLITKGKGDWTYGRIEVRAQLPAGRGSWPAIWTLGSTTPLRWPDDGEIDIMEHVGFDHGVVHASVHTRRYNHVDATQRTARTSVPDAAAGFHVYATEWTADRIATSVDGRVYFTFDREPQGGRAAWPFDAPQHLLLNVAVGGDWGGQQGVDDATLPYRFLVDYVRVYQRTP
ncbi:MAG: glycoside hydrolase family 16 protein [Vicinamibacteraceae bacterium]